MPKDQSRLPTDKHATLANVALLYYGEGLTQSDIAKRMGLSRATIVNMLREARSMGIVDIRVDGRSLAASTLSSDLAAKYGLEDVYIANFPKAGAKLSRTEMLNHLGRVGAIALSEVVKSGDRLGVAWGETIRAVSENMPRVGKPDIKVFQMIGSMISDSVPTSESCAIDIANMLGARCHTLHAPAIGSSAEVAELLRNEPTIRSQLEALTQLDMTVASIGNVESDTHLSRAAMVTEAELSTARAKGAVGILCCRFIDADGCPLPIAPDQRLIATQLDDIKSAKRRLLVVCGADRLDATRAAIRGGFVTHLCVDSELAEALQSA